MGFLDTLGEYLDNYFGDSDDVVSAFFKGALLPFVAPGLIIGSMIDSLSSDAKSKGADRYYRETKAAVENAILENLKENNYSHCSLGQLRQQAQQKAEEIGVVEFYDTGKFLEYGVYEKSKLDGAIKEDEWKYV